MYYWTSEPEDPAVYHNNTNCSEGKKILAVNKVTGNSPPPGRRLCKEC